MIEVVIPARLQCHSTQGEGRDDTRYRTKRFLQVVRGDRHKRRVLCQALT